MSNHTDREGTIIQIAQLAETVAHSLGLSVVEVRLGQTGKRRSLKITIFKENIPVALSDCESLSRQLEEVLDQETQKGQLTIDGPYMLEVESPGIERVLKTEKELCLFKGQPVRVQMTEKIDKFGALFTGILAGAERGSLRITHPQVVSKIRTNRDRKTNQQRNTAYAGDAQSETTAQQTGETEILVELAKVKEIRLNPGWL